MQKKSGLLLILAWVAGLVGLLLGLALEPMWFARFGSLMVLFSLMSEYFLLHNELNRLYVSLEKVDDAANIADLSPSKWHHKKSMAISPDDYLRHLNLGFWGFTAVKLLSKR